jgi:hypothetical protein
MNNFDSPTKQAENFLQSTKFLIFFTIMSLAVWFIGKDDGLFWFLIIIITLMLLYNRNKFAKLINIFGSSNSGSGFGGFGDNNGEGLGHGGGGSAYSGLFAGRK